MTYCCGILVKEGLVMIADTRTNAGLDNISTFRKLNIFESRGQYVMMLASAGNLSFTQNVVSLVTEGIENPENQETERLVTMPSMFEAAHLVGRAIRKVREIDGGAFQEANISFLLGGQIAGRRLRLFMIYSAGNFIECTPDAPFLQIGEHKYGKPILDRAVKYDTELYDALKIGLISMDSTMRSNLGVGLPIDIGVLRRDAQALEVNTRIDIGDIYFHDLRDRWSTALKQAHLAIPRPPYGPKV
ncbi:MAG: peptidase [Methylobacteriaceae bacterium]|nr:peptidase [Methylobacteriaceae bacterium]MBV9637353.1 peptidase [Methylobacteriaceae bacterium]